LSNKIANISSGQGGNLKVRILYVAFVATIFVVMGYTLISYGPTQKNIYKKMLMGTVVEISIMSGDASGYDKASEAAFGEIARLEKIFSNYDANSEVSRISERAGEAVKVSADVITVVKAALRVSKLSDGAFDPTIGAVAGLWGFSGEKKYIPQGKEVARLLPLVNYKNVIVDEGAKTVRLMKKHMTLNLGGVAKGFIVKRASEELKKHGVTKAIIKAGGDMFLISDNRGFNKSSFIIGIQDPRQEKKILGEAFSRHGAVTTSGDYERFFMRKGVRYAHILDPVTGYPARRSRSATIVADDPTLADALSTAVFVMGPKKGLALIESLDGVECVVVGIDGVIHNSTGFKGRLFRAGSMAVQ